MVSRVVKNTAPGGMSHFQRVCAILGVKILYPFAFFFVWLLLWCKSSTSCSHETFIMPRTLGMFIDEVDLNMDPNSIPERAT